MPYAGNTMNRRAVEFDKELELRAYSASALSATGSGTAIALKAVAYDDFACRINSAAYTSFAAGTAQWDVAVQASTTSGGTYKTIGSVTLDGTQKEYEIALSGVMIEAIVAGAEYIRVTATKTGSPGNLTYGAYLSLCC